MKLNLQTIIQQEPKSISHVDVHKKEFKKLGKKLRKLNAIFSEMNENFSVDRYGYKVFDRKAKAKSEELSNFFVIPSYRLRAEVDGRIQEIGLELKVYVSENWSSYKCVTKKLTNEMLEKPYWISADTLDYEYILKNEKKYSLLLNAIKLSTRATKKDRVKYYFESKGWIEESDYNLYRSINKLTEIPIDSKLLKPALFAQAIKILLKDSKLHDNRGTNQLEQGYIGWKQNDNVNIEYSVAKEWFEGYFSRKSLDLSFETDTLEELRILKIVSANKEAGKYRFDKKITFKDKSSVRTLEINVRSLEEFVQAHEEIFTFIKKHNEKEE